MEKMKDPVDMNNIEQYLTSIYEERAERHWRVYCPMYYRRLKQEGILLQTIKEKAHEAEERILNLMETGLYRSEAEEIALPELITFPPDEEYFRRVESETL